MEQRDEVRTIQLETLRNRMDRALNESARGEGTDGEAFVQGLLDELILGIGARPMNLMYSCL